MKQEDVHFFKGVAIAASHKLPKTSLRTLDQDAVDFATARSLDRKAASLPLAKRICWP
jgi:hypothetical protein